MRVFQCKALGKANTMQTPTDTYIEDSTYHPLVAELLKLIEQQPCHPEPEVMRILGETGGVWPRSILDEV